ncbi:MAG: hypothetical protein WCY19_04840 [Candidatus Gastranaerophilaceae bacterium]
MKIKGNILNNKAQGRYSVSNFQRADFSEQIAFGSFLNLLKLGKKPLAKDFFEVRGIYKTDNVLDLINNRKLRKLRAFTTLQDFLKNNSLKLIIDDSRKEYSAKPYYFVEIENIGWRDNKITGWGNTHEDLVGNLVQNLADLQQRGIMLDEFSGQKRYEIPNFNPKDLEVINKFRQKEFERFKSI